MRKKGKKRQISTTSIRGSKKISWFLARRVGLEEVQRNMIAVADAAMVCFENMVASVENWTELAGMVNVCGMLAQAKGKEEWGEVLNKTGDALRQIEERFRREQDFYWATYVELADLRAGVNLMNAEIFPAMTLLEFNIYAERVNDMFEVKP